MGRKTAEIRVTFTVSNHNDEQDALDQDAWQRFIERVRLLAGEPSFEQLTIDIDDLGTY